MSHTINVSAAAKKAEGRPVIKHKDALFAACAAMGLKEPEWVEDHQVAVGNPATGWAVQLKDTQGRNLTDWYKLAVFNTETGEEFADNWPIYGPKHPEVIAGKKRCYAGGGSPRWGSEELLWQLDDEYIKAANEIIVQRYKDTAKAQGDSLRVISHGSQRIELLIDHVSVGGSVGGENPLDSSDPSLK